MANVEVPERPDSDPYSDLDRLTAALFSPLTFGLSPASAMLAWADWGMHFAGAYGKRLRAAVELATLSTGLLELTGKALLDSQCKDLITPTADDHRFSDPAWHLWPFRVASQGFLLSERWLDDTARNVLGVDPHHEQIVAYALRQWIGALSPANGLLTNPVVIKRAVKSRGASLLHGLKHLVEDLTHWRANETTINNGAYVPGETVATTPGKVVYRNRIMELIQYLPTTETVHAEPILIVPAWIMKYYILDLSPHNSMIGWLVSQGFTVFCISWCNVTAKERDVSLDDYRCSVMAALGAIGEIVTKERIHSVGYCLGGTLLSIAAAAMAREGDDRLASVTLLAAQTDFSEPGGLQLFIDESQIAALEGLMWERGVLEPAQMSAAFKLLQTNELIWSRYIHEYLLGEDQSITDLMAWNADGTRMPYRMHSEYLRKLFLHNDLASGHFEVDGRTVVIQHIRAPLFVVGTEGDQVAPWRSVFKIHFLSDTDVTFVLTSGGHNAGIVNPPLTPPRRRYQIHTMQADRKCPPPDEWLTQATIERGSWWPAWGEWLTQHSSRRLPPPPIGVLNDPEQLPDAPGRYIHQH